MVVLREWLDLQEQLITDSGEDQSINQIKFLQRQHLQRSQAQWHNSQIDVQQQNRRNSSVT